MVAPEETVRTYVLAWATTDEAARRELLARCWADHGVYCDPLSKVEGRPALSDHIAAFQRSRPGFRIPLASGIDTHHEFLRFRWVMLNAEGKFVGEGFDVGALAPDGRLQRITGFFGPFPEVPPTWPGGEVWWAN
jgi:hypothetical protein